MVDSYSDLQVDPRHQYPKYAQPGPPRGDLKEGISVHTYSDKIAREEQASYLEVAHTYPQYPPQAQWRRTCGLAVKKFWLVAAIVAIIVIAAGVGGGVAATLASKSESTKSVVGLTTSTAQAASATSMSPVSGTSLPSSTSAASSSIAPIATSAAPIIANSPSSTTPGSISTSTTIGPGETLLVDCPSSDGTLYTAPSTNQLFRKICSNSLTSIGVNLNAVEQATSSLDACIAVCAAYNVQNEAAIAGAQSNVCNTVCWRATIAGDDYPGMCFGFTTSNSSSGKFEYGGDTRCDSAALLNQSF